MWMARDKDNAQRALCVGHYKPKRGSSIWVDFGAHMVLPREKFPNVKWEDGPVKVKVTIEIIKK